MGGYPGWTESPIERGYVSPPPRSVSAGTRRAGSAQGQYGNGGGAYGGGGGLGGVLRENIETNEGKLSVGIDFG